MDDFEQKGKVEVVDAYVGKRLKLRRIMLGLSQQDLADAARVSIQQIQKYEKAVNRISSGKLFTFAQLLKVPISYFYENMSVTSEEHAEGMGGTYTFSEGSKAEFVMDGGNFFSNHVPEREVITLIKFFNEIYDPQIRRRVIDLVKSLSPTDVSDEL